MCCLAFILHAKCILLLIFFLHFFPFLVSFLLLYMFCVFKYSSASSGRPEGTHSLRFIGRFFVFLFVFFFVNVHIVFVFFQVSP